MPSGEGRSHFMMQYYSYILMFVVFDVMTIFLYLWGVSLFLIPRVCYTSNYGIFSYNVFGHGICPLFVREKRNLVVAVPITNKY